MHKPLRQLVPTSPTFILLNPYPFIVVEDGEELYYEFTSIRASYAVYFALDEYEKYILRYPNLLANAVAFGLFCFPFVEDDVIPFDYRIRDTVEAIVTEYFERKPAETVMLYHCDFSDGLQAKRSKHFEYWYNRSPMRDEFQKSEVKITKPEGALPEMDYYVGYIASRSNPLLTAIDSEFKEFAGIFLKTLQSK